MQQFNEQPHERLPDQASEQPTWQAPELIKADVSTATQALVAAGFDGAIGS